VTRILRWRVVETAPDAALRPCDLAPGAGFETTEPTVAAALAAQGGFDPENPRDLDLSDFWWLADIEGEGAHVLRFEGLAGVADVFLDDAPLLTAENMFRRYEARVSLDGRARLALRFRAMRGVFESFKGRGRWRQRAVEEPRLRFLRQTQLGRVPGWAPKARVVGPWRPVALIRRDDLAPRVALSASLEGEDGLVLCEVTPDPAQGPRAGEIALTLAGRTARARLDAQGRARLELRLPSPALWWPATHGEPALHEARVTLDGREIDRRSLGFRRVAIDKGEDGEGFGFTINAVPIFARGAVWVPPDLARLPDEPETLRRSLAAMVEAGMNMTRVAGPFFPESRAFYELCDELGLMVWQDFSFANLDYPAEDPEFRAEVAAEAEDFFDRVGPSPSLVALCGGAEVAQQAAMLGLPRAAWSNSLFDELLPGVAARRRPDCAYLPNTPFGGALPFMPDKGVTHYYGVSAYKRGLDDATLARPRFASEWLGFNHVPDHDPALDENGVAQPCFGAKIEGDTGAVWWFEGVRDHYLRLLYDVDPAALRRDDPARYLDFSRAVTAEAATETIARWRRAGSPTRGAISLMLRDAFAPGAGWGLRDHRDAAKPVWRALARAFRPVRVVLTDEGLNGTRLTLINETPRPVAATLHFACLRDGATPVASARRAVELAPHAATALAATDLLGGFFDVTYAYRFGPPSHDVVVARLTGEDGATLDESFLFPLGRAAALADSGLSARLVEGADGPALTLSCARFAQNVRIVCAGWDLEDNGFHLAPGGERSVRLRPRAGAPARPRGSVRALGDDKPVAF
jgi:beta-mannosidase